MKTYLVDANFILRFLLADNVSQFKQVKNILETLKKSETRIKITSEVVMEVEYVLRKVYKIPRRDISQLLQKLFRNDLLEVEKRSIILQALEKYENVNLDLVDVVLFYQAEAEKAFVISFDRDFKKLK